MSISETTLDPSDIKYSVKGIRSITLRFDKIKKTENDEFILILDDEILCQIHRKHLDDKTISKLESLAEWELKSTC
jgi:hypothetical protein